MYGIAVLKSNNQASIKMYGKATSLESFGHTHLNRKLVEEGFELNKAGCLAYIQSWIDHMEEQDNPMEIMELCDFISDQYTYTEHLQKLVGNVWKPLTSDEKKIFCKAIYDRLTQWGGL